MPITNVYRERRSQPGTYTKTTTNTTGTGRLISRERSIVKKVPKGATVLEKG